MSFAKFLRIPFFIEYLRRLLLYIIMKILWLHYRYFLWSFSNTFRNVRHHRLYTQVLLVEKKTFFGIYQWILQWKNNEFEFNAASVCVKFQRWFFFERRLQTSTDAKATRETLKKVWNMFKVNNEEVNDVLLVPLLSTLNKFYISLLCFHWWLWSEKCFSSRHLLHKVNNVKKFQF